jgi:glycosyltransferase involved in cell wall biosynthesis
MFSAGRLRLDHKAFDLLIAAFAEVARSYQPLDLLIAGEGPDRAHLQQLICQNGLRDRVRLLGAVSRQELWSLHKGSLFFAMPSRMAEGLGLVFMEAMASAKAVIGSAVGGVSEIVSQGRMGALLEKNDVALLAATLRRFLDEPENTHKMGEAGYHQIAAWHSWSQVAADYLALYRAAIRRQSQRQPVVTNRV